MARDLSAYFQDIHDACCVIEDVFADRYRQVNFLLPHNQEHWQVLIRPQQQGS